MILLTWAVEKYRKANGVDRKLRSFFQHLGAIPGAVSQTIPKLKKYELEANADECSENIAVDMKSEIQLPLLQNDRQTLEYPIFIVGAVHSKGITAKQRKQLLTSFGFKIDDTDTPKAKVVDPNSLTLLGFFPVFVIPLAAVFASIAGGPKIGNESALTFVVWSAMAVFAGLVSVYVPIVVCQARESSRNTFWRSIRPSRGCPWCSYLLAGIMAGGNRRFGNEPAALPRSGKGIVGFGGNAC